MEPFILGVIVGASVGYAVRALISHVRHRRFEEDYGYTSRFPPGDWPDRSPTPASQNLIRPLSEHGKAGPNCLIDL